MAEKESVRKELEEYFGKRRYTLKGFGKYRKTSLSRGTGLYVIEVDVEEWEHVHYALVTVSRGKFRGSFFSIPNRLLRL